MIEETTLVQTDFLVLQGILSNPYLLRTWTSSWKVIPNGRTDHESLREIVGSFIFIDILEVKR
nr:MAG TPA: Tryptophan operon leader peptide [Caudoviricetes sp.]DAW17613.1 MAG TPA: Tryptophan operon leader peptide [Caudoviricetes sp.]